MFVADPVDRHSVCGPSESQGLPEAPTFLLQRRRMEERIGRTSSVVLGPTGHRATHGLEKTLE